MPPVLDVALGKLARRSSQNVFAGKIPPGGRERHYILKLVTKTVRAADLIKSGSSPNTAWKVSDRAASG